MATKRSRTQTTYGWPQPLDNSPGYFYADRAPTSADSGNIGVIWIDQTGNKAYILTSVVAGVSAWAIAETTSGSATFSSLTVNGPTDLNGALTVASGTGAINISADAAATAVNIATGAGAKTLIMGSTNTTSSTAIRSGSGALSLTSTNGAMSLASGTGAMNISADAAATTVNLATGAAVKTLTIGSTNTTSSTAIQSGSGALSLTSTNGAMSLASGTGALNIGADAAAKAITIGNGTVATGIALEAGANSSFVTAGAGVNLTLQSGGGTLLLEAGEAVTNAIAISATSAGGGVLIETGAAGSDGEIQLRPAVGTAAADTQILNAFVGVATYTGLTTAMGASATLTLTNDKILATTGTLVSVANLNASTNGAFLTIDGITQAVGSIVVSYTNNGAGALGAGDNVLLSFMVLNP